MKQRIASVEQDYALLASRGGGEHYITGRGSRFSRECGDPGYSAIEPDPDSYSPQAIHALMGDRNPVDLEFVTVNVTAAGGNVGRDIAVIFGRPWMFFMIASITNAAKGVALFVHLAPLSYSTISPTNVISETGLEPWIPMANTNESTASCVGRYFRMNRPLGKFYIDADHGFGVVSGGYYITFLGTNDLAVSTGLRL